jgi:hypothetical protein
MYKHAVYWSPRSMILREEHAQKIYTLVTTIRLKLGDSRKINTDRAEQTDVL